MKRIRLCILVLVGCAGSVGASWQAGLAREVITPQEPLWMSGYASRTEPAQGKLTELWAKCLALEDSEGRLAVLVTMDLVGIGREMSLEIRRELERRYGLPLQNVMLSTSHTHTGPVVGNNLGAMYFYDDDQAGRVEAYAEKLKSQVIELVGRAVADLGPAKLSWGLGRATFAVNRRNNSEPDIESLREQGELRGPVDHDVPVLVVRGVEDELRGIVTGYACHATCLSSYQWSGDWPGFAQLDLEKRHPDATVMVWAGCGADQNPLPRRTVELAEGYGRMLAEAVEAVLAGEVKVIAGKLTTRYAEIPLQFNHIPSKAELSAATKSENRYEASRARLLLTRLEQEGDLSATYPYPVQAWRLGDGPAWVALGGEVVVDYALRLKAEYDRLWVTAYANDVMAYIPSERVLAEGGYEGGGAMLYYGLPSPWAAGVENQIIKEIRRQLRSLDVAPHPQRRAIYPNHADLWVYLDQENRPQQVRTAEDWARRREQILVGMQKAMGPLPDMPTLPPLDVREESRVEIAGGKGPAEKPTAQGETAPRRLGPETRNLKPDTSRSYWRVKLSYRADAGRRVPAYLLIPKGLEGRGPAMLCLHQTTPFGKDEPAGIKGRRTIHVAHELAQRGYVCLVPDYPSFGEYQPYDFEADGYESGTMKGIVNHIRGVDLLSTRPEVDPERIGVIGHSLGGHNAMYVAVFDPRLKVIVSSCGWNPFHEYYEGKIGGWTSDRYMPRLKTLYGLDPNRVPFDFYEVVAALAPRAFFSNSPIGDGNFEVRGVRKAEAVAGAIYRMLGHPEQMVIRYPDHGHDFPDEVREEAYAFVDQTLRMPTE